MIYIKDTKWFLINIFLFFVFMHVAYIVHGRVARLREQFSGDRVPLVITSGSSNYFAPLFNVLMVEDDYYKDLINDIFDRFDVTKMLPPADMDDHKNAKIAEIAKDNQYLLLTLANATVYCTDVKAPFVVGTFMVRMFGRDKELPDKVCVVQIDKSLINRSDMIYFLASLTPAIKRKEGSSNLGVAPSSQPIKFPPVPITNWTTATGGWSTDVKGSVYGNGVYKVRAQQGNADDPYLLFDGQTYIPGSAVWTSINGFNETKNALMPAVAELHLPVPIILGYYKIQASNEPAMAPSAWRVEGSVDGGYSWEAIVTDNYNNWRASRTLRFDALSGKAYKAFRWVLLRTNGADRFQIAKIMAFGMPSTLNTITSELEFDAVNYDLDKGVWRNTGALRTLADASQSAVMQLVQESKQGNAYIRFEKGKNHYFTINRPLTWKLENTGNGVTVLFVGRFAMTGAWETVFHFLNETPGAAGYLYYCRFDSDPMMLMLLQNNANESSPKASNLKYVDTNWHVYAFTLVNVGSSMSARFYRDNMDAKWTGVNLLSVYNMNDIETNLNYIGTSIWNENFIGDMRYLKVYNRVLSDDVLANEINVLKARYDIM